MASVWARFDAEGATGIAGGRSTRQATRCGAAGHYKNARAALPNLLAFISDHIRTIFHAARLYVLGVDVAYILIK